MRSFLYVLFLNVVLFTVHGQDTKSYNYKLTYDMYLNFGGEQKFTAELLFNREQARFNYQAVVYENSSDEDDSDDNVFDFQITDTTQYFIISSLVENTVVELVKSFDRKSKNLFVRGSLPQIEWEVTDSTKMIGSYLCMEVIGRFAGRNYNVWFAPELPAYFGPHKLHGLPGVVLEAYDDLYEVGFVCTNIQNGNYGYSQKDEALYEETISRTEYDAEVKKKMTDMLKKISSRFDRGLNVQMESVKTQSIEKYE